MQLTSAYMRSAEPWISLPEEYLHTPENPRPEFSFGLGVKSIEQLIELGAFLNPDLAAAIKADSVVGLIAAKSYLETLCGLPRATIEVQCAYSREAPLVLSLGNTHDGIDLELCADYREKIEEELERLKWPNPILKWYITDEKIRSRRDWSTAR